MDNPYIGAASSMLSSALHAAASMRSAEEQARLQREQQRKAALAEEMDYARLLNQGWQEYNPSQNVTTEASGLKRRDYQPPPRNVVTFPSIGRQVFRPEETRAEVDRRTTNERMGTGQLMTAFEREAQPVEGGHIYAPGGAQAEQDAQASLISAHRPVPDPSRVIKVGGREVYMPTADERAAAGTRRAVDRKKATTDATLIEHAGLQGALEEAAGLEPGTLNGIKFDQATIRTGIGRLTPQARNAPEKKPTAARPITNASGQVNMTRTDAEGRPQQWNGTEWVPMAANAPIGAPRRQGGGEGPKPPSATQIKTVVTTRANDFKKAKDTFNKAQTDRLATAATRAQAQQQFVDAMQAAEDKYVQSLAALGIEAQPVDYRQKAIDEGWGRPQSQPKRGRLTDTKIAADYLKRAGGDKAKARQLAAVDGWEL